ncbi:MAG: quinoprotein, partial [Pseudomonadota bacterium]
MSMRPRAVGRLALAGLAVLLVAACTDDEEARLPGERASIRPEAAPDVASAAPRAIPAARDVAEWSHADGDAARAGGHLAAPSSLTLAWRADAGAGSGDRGIAARPVVSDGLVYVRDGRASV